MARSSKKPASPPSNDPFEDVDAKSITEIELDQRVDIEREALPAAARLTDLPLKWVLLTLILCIGASELAQRVERKQLIQAARDSGLLKEEDAAKADEVDQVVAGEGHGQGESAGQHDEFEDVEPGENGQQLKHGS